MRQPAAARSVDRAAILGAAAAFALLTIGAGVLPQTQAEGRAGSQTASPESFSYSPEEDASYERGGNAYYQLCHVCHGEDGTGALIIDDPDGRRLAPSLSRSRRVVGRPEYVITALLSGVTGLIDEENYQAQMVSMASYGDAWIADVASYIRNSFDNQATMITSNQVARIRLRLAGRADPFTVEEILSTLPAPLTNQASWKVSASHNANTALNAITPRSADAWTSESPQTTGMWFQIELPTPISLWDLNFAAPLGDSAATTGFPRAYKVQVSLDGSKWSDPVIEGRNRAPFTLIAVGPVQAKLIRITLTSTPLGSPPWNISRTQILQEGKPLSSIAAHSILNPFE